MTPAPVVPSSARWPASPWRSRTSWSPRAYRPPAARRSSRAGGRPTAPRSPPGWPRRAPCCWARPTWTSSRWAPPPRTRPTGSPATRGTSTASRAVPRVGRAPRSPATSRRGRSAPTPAGSSPRPPPSLAPWALGPDPGGSIRQPAAVTGLVGHKPTYGSVSRYGLIAFSSSLDQAGPMARTVFDAAVMHEVIGGHDPRDSTSIDAPLTGLADAARAGAAGDLRGLRIGVVRELGGEGHTDGYEPDVLARTREAIE